MQVCKMLKKVNVMLNIEKSNINRDSDKAVKSLMHCTAYANCKKKLFLNSHFCDYN